jgi:hypothetical protein
MMNNPMPHPVVRFDGAYSEIELRRYCTLAVRNTLELMEKKFEDLDARVAEAMLQFPEATLSAADFIHGMIETSRAAQDWLNTQIIEIAKEIDLIEEEIAEGAIPADDAFEIEDPMMSDECPCPMCTDVFGRRD